MRTEWKRSSTPRGLIATAVTLAAIALSGCATSNLSAPMPADPWERTNRATHAFNEALDRTVAKPIAKGYVRVVPRVARTGVDNFLSNLAYPTTLVNNLLQAKFKAALQDTGRLLMNSTIGIGGLLDPASVAGLPRHDEDFGQTLGKWGVPSGPFVNLPFLGPSTLRDTPALVVDNLTDGRTRTNGATTAVEASLIALSLVNRRANLLQFDATLDGAYDRYALIRNAYLQRREFEVRDGDVPAEDPLEDPLEDPADEEAATDPDATGSESPPPAEAPAAG